MKKRVLIISIIVLFISLFVCGWLFLINNKPILLEVEGKDLTSNNYAILPKNNIAKNKTIIFKGTFDSFNKLEIRRQKDDEVHNTIIIDNENLIVKNDVDKYEYTFKHGLSIKNYISIRIEQKTSDDISDPNEYYDFKVIIESNRKKYSTDYLSIKTTQSYDDLLAISRGMTFKSYSFSLTTRDFKKDIYLFGDSYLSLNEARWPYYLGKDGYLDNILINAYSGENSYRAIQAFNTIKEKGNPTYIVWALGMNDPDDGAINGTYKESIDEVVKYCKENNIVLILATIPNTPDHDNNYKNDYIRKSGYRYIDFADAVQSSYEASTWKDGMLSVDNVHPTPEGAKQLYSQVLKDFPEIKNK